MAWRLVELTTKYRAGEIAEADYQTQLRALTGARGNGPGRVARDAGG